jgi:hypothetical protein
MSRGKALGVMFLIIIAIVVVAVIPVVYDQYTFQKFVDAGCTPIAGNPSGDIWNCPPGVKP